MPLEELKLTPYQKEKLESYFNILEPDENRNLTNDSLNRIVKRICAFTQWPENSVKMRHCREIHAVFFEILWEKTEKEGGKAGMASLETWYKIWSHILPGVKGMSSFPVWLRLMPNMLFQIMDRDGDEEIVEEELVRFYKGFLKIETPDSELKKHTHEAYKYMTDNGRYKLNIDLYEQLFANFLIGKTSTGPGKYLFGLFQPKNETKFQLLMPSAD